MIITADGNIPSKYAHSFNVMKMAQGFVDAGQEVTVVSLLSLPNIIERYKIKDIYSFYGISKKIDIRLLPVFNKDFFTKTIGARGFNKKAALFIKKSLPEFVYCRSYLTACYCVESGIPSILETHTTHYDHPDLLKIYGIAKDPNFLGLVTIHESIKKEHIKRGVPKDKVLVLEDGVDLTQFDIREDRHYWRKQLDLPENKKIVLYCGSLYKEKGIEDILRTAKRLEQHKDITFVLVGGNDDSIQHWKKYSRNNQIERLIFTGFVNNSLVPMYLKSADVLIMPYNTNVDYDQMDLDSTSPLKLFEYMASQRPVVSTNIPVISKIVKHDDSALLAETNNVDTITGLVLELLNNPQKASTISRKAFEIVQQFSWKNRCETISSKLAGGHLRAV